MKKIAIAYENGQIFQHFGKTPSFLIVETEDKNILSQEVVSTNGEGHSALFQFLAGLGANVVICGGIGQGARDALVEGGMEVIGGQQGSAEAALMFYLNGDLRDTGAGCCGHHHGEEHSCGEHHHEGHSCGDHHHEDGHSCGHHHDAGHSWGEHGCK